MGVQKTEKGKSMFEGEKGRQFAICGTLVMSVVLIAAAGSTLFLNAEAENQDWDVNDDGYCNLLDINQVSYYINFNTPSNINKCDINNNGIVNQHDVQLMESHCEWQSGSESVGSGSSDTQVNIDPSSQTVSHGESFTVDVYCDPGQSIRSFQFNLSFDETLLQADSVTNVGEIFTDVGYSIFSSGGTIDNPSGNIIYVWGTISGPGATDVPGKFATIEFTAEDYAGISDLNLYNVKVTNETDYVPITVSDGTVTVVMNKCPTANDDYYSTNWHTSLDVAAPGVLDNDADPDGDSLTANKLTNPSNGIITAFNSDGSFEYVPDSTFVGSDTFTYEADDGNGGTDTATVHITVIPPTCQDEVWVDDNYHSGTPGWFIDHFYHMQDAMYVISANGIVHVMDGTYQEDIIVDVDSPYCIGRSNLLIQGEDLPVDDNTRALIDGTIEINTDLTILEYFWFMPTIDAAVTVNGNDATLRNNVFEHGCDPDSIGVYATKPVNAEYNWWGAPNGPNGGLMNDGTTADGYGVQVIGSVDIEPWVGVHAKAEASSYSVETGEPVIFNAAGSFAADFDGTYEPVYYWTFEPTMHSNDKQHAYVFDTPGTYEVSLRVRGNGIGGLHSNFMYDWAYLTITVTSPGAPLSANADGGNLDGYETIVGEPVRLSGLGSGGTLPYSYSWSLGDGRTSSDQNPTVVYENEDTYTVILTVTDSMGATASDTAQVSVYSIDDLIVNIGGPHDGVAGTPMYLISSVIGGVEPYTYSWDLGDGTISDLTNPTHTYESEGTYTVTLTVTDDQGTTDTDTTVITVEEQEEEAVIGEIQGGFGVKTTIDAGDSPVSWSIEVNGRIFLGGQASGTIPAHDSQTVKLPFSLGLGKVNIIITANSVTKEATAFMLGPFVLSVKEAQ